MYYLYIHTTPDGKVYVGQSKNPKDRWLNGKGYEDNVPFYKAIKQYGWENIKHEVVGEFNNQREAENYEAVLIFLLNSENPTIGYNQTKIRETILDLYATRSPMEAVKTKKAFPGINIFEASGLPVSACNELINQWIFNAKNREIARDRLINGMQFTELSKKYNLSVRQIKGIMSENIKMLEDHI